MVYSNHIAVLPELVSHLHTKEIEERQIKNEFGSTIIKQTFFKEKRKKHSSYYDEALPY